jgi:hypothetical protein
MGYLPKFCLGGSVLHGTRLGFGAGLFGIGLGVAPGCD